MQFKIVCLANSRNRGISPADSWLSSTICIAFERAGGEISTETPPDYGRLTRWNRCATPRGMLPS